jgi:hypothetical protein
MPACVLNSIVWASAGLAAVVTICVTVLVYQRHSGY